MKDYYAILGLDSDASKQAIKLSYRRLALQAHPDRLTHLSPADQASASARMAELNEAYNILCDDKRRRQYDEKLRDRDAEEQQHPAGPQRSTPDTAVATAVAARVAAAAAANAASAQRSRVRPDGDLASNVVMQFSGRVQRDVMAIPVLRWKPLPLEGFDWALRAGGWPRYYLAAFRGFGMLTSTHLRKFSNYCDVALQVTKYPLARESFLFFLAFQRAANPDELTLFCKRFGQRFKKPVSLLIYDVTNGRSLVVKNRHQDEKIQQIVKKLAKT